MNDALSIEWLAELTDTDSEEWEHETDTFGSVFTRTGEDIDGDPSWRVENDDSGLTVRASIGCMSVVWEDNRTPLPVVIRTVMEAVTTDSSDRGEDP